MAKTVGKLKGGDLNLLSDANERLPIIQNGLVAHYPMDGTDLAALDKRNLIDYSTWVIGSNGSQTGFSGNGESAANTIAYYDNP